MSRGWDQAFFSGAQEQDEGQQAQTGTQEVPSEHEEELLYCGTGCTGGLCVSFSGDSQNPPECSPVNLP